MKSHLFFLIITFIFLTGCIQPIAQSLLVDRKNNCADTTAENCSDSSSTSSNGALDIQAFSGTKAVPMEESDRVEIMGSCTDLNRKENRILVEVFAGEDESSSPYVSNAISNNCLNTTSVDQSGLNSGSGRCFWVTKGASLIVDPGLPSEKNFPQCHNGQFGFSVRLGRVLLNATPGQANLKYLVRFKLQTTVGLLAESPWSKVVIDRNLTTPVITATPDQTTLHKCTIKSSPARFNFGILYTLNRTYTDIASTNAGSTNLYTDLSTSILTAGGSVFEWDNSGISDGVTYNYTLTSKETNFAYSPTIPTLNSTVVTCAVPKPVIVVSQQPGTDRCFLNITAPATLNSAVYYEWSYSTNAGWTGADSNTLTAPIGSACSGTAAASCTQTGLATGTTYYFAVRTRFGAGGPEIGRWSAPVGCRTN